MRRTALLVAVCVLVLAGGCITAPSLQVGTDPDIEERVEALEKRVEALEARLATPTAPQP